MMDQQLARPVRSRSSRGRKEGQAPSTESAGGTSTYDGPGCYRPMRRLLQDAHMGMILPVCCYAMSIQFCPAWVGWLWNKQRYSTGECGQTKFCR